MTGEDDAVWGGRNYKFANPEAKLWLERMGAKGWTAPTWPAEYGGGGLSADQNRVLQSELKRINARPPPPLSRSWCRSSAERARRRQ